LLFGAIVKFKTSVILLPLMVFILFGCWPERFPTVQHQSTAQNTQRLLNLEEKINVLISQMTLAEKTSLVHATGKFKISAIERLGIHEMWLSDGPHGVRYEMERDGWAPANWLDDHSTYLPNLTSVAASWDPQMASLHGNVLGSEARHRRKDFILGPGVNLARLPLYGRNFEYMGEDPILAAKLVVPAVQAIQKNDVAATVKHYALNTQELNRTGVNAKPDERTLREVYLPAFEAAVKEGGVLGVMGSYNQYFGTNANQSKHLVMDILKGEWGYQGVLLTDWNVDINTFDAAIYGLDIEMGTDVESYDDYFLADPLIEMIVAGKVPVAVLDDKVRRILRVQFSIGMMDQSRLSGQRNTKQHQQDAKTIAANGVVLLKNENVLPLTPKTLKNVLVLGANADKKHGFGGGSSEVKSLYEVTPLEGLQARLGDEVKITVMRTRSNDLSSIAADYIATRHWTGTPAWNITFYNNSDRKETIEESWIVDSAYRGKGNTSTKFIRMAASITPLKSGIHTFKMSSAGEYSITVDGKTIMSANHASHQVDTMSIELTSGKAIDLVINFNGHEDFTLGWDAPGNLFSTEEEYLSAAAAADTVIYFGGLSHGDDREAIDRPDMQLPHGQDEIIAKLLAANPQTIIFMIAGSAVEMPWAEKAKAIVWGWYAGMEAGNAFAEVLTGDVNPGGKMPISLPEYLSDTSAIMLNDYNAQESLYPEGVFIGYRWFEKNNIRPMFPFGHGLSYTTFKYSNISLSSTSVGENEDLEVRVTIRNTGTVAGSEVVQLYLNDKEASVERPAKELKGFNKVFLEAGESKTVSMRLKQRDLSFWDIKSNNWLAEKGEFKVLLGSSSADIRLTASFNYMGH